MMNNTPYQQTGSLQISFPHWLWTSPLLFTFVRLRLPQHEQFSPMSIPKSNSEIVILPVLCHSAQLFISMKPLKYFL